MSLASGDERFPFETSPLSPRAGLGLSHLPIIACTSESLPAIWRELAEAGVDDYHPKPIEADDLVETLLRWISPEPTR